MKLKLCRKICSDPDLIVCEIQGGRDERGTNIARRQQIEFIRDCNLRKKCKCKWTKQIDNWIFSYLK